MENCLTKFPTGFRGLEKFLLPAASDIANSFVTRSRNWNGNGGEGERIRNTGYGGGKNKKEEEVF